MNKLLKSPVLHAFLYAVFIFILSALPNPPILGPLLLNDKIKHMLLYAVFAALVCRVIGPRHRSAVVAASLAIVLVSLYGGSDEYHQRFTPGRTCDVHDWEADTLAAVLVAACYPWRRRTARE